MMKKFRCSMLSGFACFKNLLKHKIEYVVKIILDIPTEIESKPMFLITKFSYKNVKMNTQENSQKINLLDFSSKIFLKIKEKIKNSTNVKMCAAVNSDLKSDFEIGLKNRSVANSTKMYIDISLSSNGLFLLKY